MAAATCSFLSKLSPELRLRIYAHVFGLSRVIKPGGSDTAIGIRKDPTAHIRDSFTPPAAEVCLNISVLLTNKFIFAEALPVLYDEKIIRATTKDFNQLLQNADFMERGRRVEIADCIGYLQDGQFHSVLRRLQVLSQIRSLVILSDCLGLVDQRLAGGHLYLTVARFCEIAQLGEARCVQIGRYQLHGMFGRFEVVNRRLLQMWPEVQNTPKDRDAYQDIVTILQQRTPQDMGVDYVRIAQALQTSLYTWVYFHDLLISMTVSGELEHLRGSHEGSQANKFLIFKHYAETTRPHAHFDAEHLLDGTVARSDLRRWLLRDIANSDDYDLLSWATEYLSANIFAYIIPMRPHARRFWAIRRSSWAMTDGCMPTIEFRQVCLEHAASGLATQTYIPCPQRLGSAIYRDEAFYYLERCRAPFNDILMPKSRRNLPELSNVEMKQITHLCVALDDDYMIQSAQGFQDKPGSHDLWSCDLLRRYTTATSPCLLASVRHAPVDDLRKVGTRVLSVIACPEEMMACGLTQASAMTDAAPPADFDGDLFRPLAWQCGALLDRAWREYVASANSTTMDLG